MRLAFELDPQIIHHIIYSQAGSIGKAVIELLMNAADAGAKTVQLTMTKDGLKCADDGHGFASRVDVLRYFGRFGTPHQEGDATYGRFRLGRGQIMAHARTQWFSNHWQMTVDTQEMGYNYDLEDLEDPYAGCLIVGTWYQPLNDLELMASVQEIRDLVRYTSISIELNGKIITRDPASEKWDLEDEWAYYRAKEEGAVAIYNQGVLVRHDASHVWGAGGLIVSKKAIGLNVSRTEILRKTCPVWKAIAKAFDPLAKKASGQMGKHRKTEARREQSARLLLSGDPQLNDIFWNEEVITVLPGKRHLTLEAFVRKAQQDHKNTYSVAYSRDVPKGEGIAQQGIVQVIHPQTLERFGCHSIEDFVEALDRVVGHVVADNQNDKSRGLPWYWDERHGRVPQVPQLVAFSTLKEAFLERTSIVDEKKVLDKETRRAWVALRWCLQHYAGACMGVELYKDHTIRASKDRMHVLLGESNTNEAWTDGQTYLAINIDIVKRLKSDPMKTAAYIFGLVEHEVAHQGDSLDCGHDEAFYQRFHDISLRMASDRQWFMHKWLMKYTMSMELEGQKAAGNAWAERYLVDRVGTGRMKRGLTAAIEDPSSDPLVTTPVPEQNMALLNIINVGLIDRGICPPPPDWQQVLEQARQDQQVATELHREQKMLEDACWEDERRDNARLLKEGEQNIARILELELADIPQNVLQHLGGMVVYYWCDEQDVRDEWARIQQAGGMEAFLTGDDAGYEPDDYDDSLFEAFEAETQHENATADPRGRLDEDCRQYVQEGETWWSLKHNSASAGFHRVEHYLKWRHSNEPEQALQSAEQEAQHGKAAEIQS